MMNIKEIPTEELLTSFKKLNVTDLPLVKTVMRELFNRELTFEENQEKSFLSLCAEVLPDLLAKRIRCKTAFEVLTYQDKTFKSWDPMYIDQPYLLREQQGEVLGMVRVKSCKQLDSKEYEYEVKDLIPFIYAENKSDLKFNDEKMQMFSVAYRSWEAWKQEDTDGEYIREDDLNSMVKQVAETGINVNLEHVGSTVLNKSDVRIIEFYQSRSDFVYEGLQVKTGDVVSTTQFYPTTKGQKVWNDLKDGVYSTYSIEGDKNVGWERTEEYA